MKEGKLTYNYISFLNDVKRSPMQIFYVMEERIGSRDLEDLIYEADFCIAEVTEEQKEHKKKVVRFLLENWKIYKPKCQ